MATNADKVHQWGKMRPETMRILLDAICEGQTARKNVLAWLCGIIRTADNIPDRERRDVVKWLVANGYTVNKLNEVYTVQYTHEECAAATGCAVRESKRQREWLVNSNVLITVQSGKKGYPGLFILAPVLVSGNVTQNDRNTVSGNVTECKQDRVSCNSGFGDTGSKIGCHAQLRDLQDAFLSRVIQSNPEKGGEKWSCSRCGARDFTLSPDGALVICKACDTAHKPP